MSSSVIKNNTGIIIQARMGSKRFPGKVMENLINGNTVLEYLFKRLSSCKNINNIIVATTTSNRDDVLVNWLKRKNISFYRGSEENCLERYCNASNDYNISTILRITSDCPLIIPEIVDEMISYYLINYNEIDYLSNREYTNFPEGLDIEIFKKEMLEDALNDETTFEEREHINYYFLKRPHKYRIRYFNHNLNKDYSKYRLSIDKKDDLSKIKELFQKGLKESFTFKELIKVLEN